MASDIVLYKADTVPVGDDQLPHLEFTREIVRRFNHQFGPVLVEPQARLTTVPRVMGTDGVNKMSKSLNNHLELSAPPEELRKRIMGMVTDPARRLRSDPGHPEVCNVFALHKVYSPNEVAQIEADCRSARIGCVECKKRFAENLLAALAPFQARRAELAARPGLVKEVLDDGARRASALARETLTEVKTAMGLV